MKKAFFAKGLNIWRKIRRNWKIKYRLVIQNESLGRESFSLRLSPRNIFVVVTVSAVALIVLTALLIAFTPLRVYVPGYTNPDEYRKYREAQRRVDSVEILLAQNQQYIDNFYRILHNEVMPNEMPEETNGALPDNGNALEEAAAQSESELALRDEADDLLRTVAIRDEVNDDGTSVDQRAAVNRIFLQPPTSGSIVNYFSTPHRQYGIDVANKPGTLVTAAADGVVIFSGYDVYDGYVLILQHSDNVLSVYKHNRRLLQSKGTRVKVGEAIAEMGATGVTKLGSHLRFEIWHNGLPADPLNFLTLR